MTDSALYLHIPYCIRKCDYCDFCSVSDLSSLDGFMHRMTEDIARRGRENALPLQSIFFGGGTPTRIGAERLALLLDTVKSSFTVTPGAEITVEVNPGTCDLEGLLLLKESGVNRISVGCQTFVNEELRLLGRLSHTAEDSVKAIELVKRAGIENFSMDLMYGIPGQSIKSLVYSLEKAISLGPKHISAYALQIEDKTPLWQRRDSIDTADGDLCCDMYLCITDILEKSGYPCYEISNFARPGYECRHNLRYWLGGDYIGIGPCASGFEKGVRYTGASTVDAYVKGEDAVSESKGDTKDRIFEFVMLRLRLAFGINKQLFSKTFGIDLDLCAKNTMEKYEKWGYAVNGKHSFYLTPKGRFVSNTVINDLLEDLL